jgi:hypothetical protein
MLRHFRVKSVGVAGNSSGTLFPGGLTRDLGELAGQSKVGLTVAAERGGGCREGRAGGAGGAQGDLAVGAGDGQDGLTGSGGAAGLNGYMVSVCGLMLELQGGQGGLYGLLATHGSIRGGEGVQPTGAEGHSHGLAQRGGVW